jgi:urea transporter
MAAVADLLAAWDVPTLTAPFVLATWFFLLATYQFTHIHATTALPPPVLPTPVTLPGAITPTTYVEGFFKGVAEVFLQDNLLTGAIFLVALLVNSRVSFLAAAMGSLVGLLIAVVLGAPESSIRLGLYGFNSVLTAIALVGIFYLLDWKSVLYALLGVIVTAIVYASLTHALAPLGVPALTAPFVIVTWFFLLAKTSFPPLRPISPGHASTPENNLMAGTRGGSDVHRVREEDWP